ncbi:hypothetical protein PpBr36_00027 [Pyricularia pennisetigena]|uniref:hypothetical protein n=1 Tax=Pyricularia pennisetigena TaxID=1578925 RepID=UPI0011548AD2|nr:hypothetical protein PpBr36_00027 [Pyricularia pennisetigena]TLS29257.1 hypothetical protein PpBr36_00027 [Pyricularia pennisetigena]
MVRPSKSITSQIYVSRSCRSWYGSPTASAGRVLVRTAALTAFSIGINRRPFCNLLIGSPRQNAFPVHQRVNFSSSPTTAQVKNDAGSLATPALSGTFADLFCGIGAATVALSELGLKCVYANDNDPRAAATYEQNLRGGLDFVDKRSIVDAVRDDLENIPRANMLAASLPAMRRTSSRDHSDYFQLVVDSFLRLVQYQRNEVVLLEFEKKRVAKTSTGGDGMEEICKILDQAGYWIEWELYSAASFGLPQTREHIVALAVRKDLIPGPFRPPRAENEPDRTLELKDFLLSIEDYQRLNKYRICWPDGRVPEPIDGVLFLKYLNQMPRKPPKSYRILLDHRDPLQRPAGRFRFNQIRVGCRIKETGKGEPTKPTNHEERIYHQRGWSGCVTGRGYLDMGHILTSGPSDGHGGVVPCVRQLHPREGARLVGLPDSFVLPGNQKHAWTLLGKTVPPQLLKWPLLSLARAHPHLFEPGRPEKQPPPSWPDAYPHYLARTYTEGAVGSSKIRMMRALRERLGKERICGEVSKRAQGFPGPVQDLVPSDEVGTV